MTLPSRILIRLPADERLAMGDIDEESSHQSRTISGIINGPPTGHQDTKSTTIPLRAILQAIKRAILRAINGANLQTICRVSRRHAAGNGPNDTPYAEPSPRAMSNDERDEGRSGTETERYVRGLRV